MGKNFSGQHDFHPLISRWFQGRYGEPTEIQQRSWPVIARGGHVLISAPTGSGKTLTAFLNALDALISGRLSTGGLRILYISPLKALNNDIRRNLLSPLEELTLLFEKEGEPIPHIRVSVRSGDTDPDERRSMLRSPPEILITTPESLNILLTSKGGRKIFEGLKVVILDEIHAVAQSKRGTHLMTAVERLELLAPGFQRISLSATVRPVERIAAFVGGYYNQSTNVKDPAYTQRPVQVIESSTKKAYHLEVDFPVAAGGSANRGEWPEDVLFGALIRRLKDVIARNRSTLIFTNSRRMAEKISMLLNEGEERILAYCHHGALSREIRQVVERSLKEGSLPAVVATASLELGIDIGDLDQVVLLQSPGLLSTTLQRLGRAGHRVGEVSRGLFLPLHGRDLLQSAMIAGSLESGQIEEIRPVMGALDVLSQVILSMVCTEKWNPDELFVFLRSSYPYHDLEKSQFDSVIEMLTGRFATSRIRELRPRIHFDRVENRIHAREGVPFLLYMNGGTIPDRGYYGLRHFDTRSKIGELDEEFVWERSVGDTFTLGNQSWRIMEINHNDVLVIPASGESPAMAPFWRAEAQDRGSLLSEKLALFLESHGPVVEGEGFRKELEKIHYLTPAAARYLQDFLALQKEKTGAALPHRHNLIVEHYDDPVNRSDRKMVILHTLWGGRVNRPFSLALKGGFDQEYGLSVEVMHDDDCIMVMLPHELGEENLFRLVRSDNLEKRLKGVLASTGFFGALFRQSAGVSMLLPGKGFKRRTPLWLNRLRSRKILQSTSRFENFPVMLETWRSCLSDEFDLKTLSSRLIELESGEIRITETITNSPSPFSRNLIWQQTNYYMYQDDTPGADHGGSPGESFFSDLARNAGLRPSIPDHIIELYRSRIMRTAPGYEPDDAPALLDLIRDRVFITEAELKKYYDALDEVGLDKGGRLALEQGLVRVSFDDFSSHTAEFDSIDLRAGLICVLEIIPLLRYSLNDAPLYISFVWSGSKELSGPTTRALNRLEEEFLQRKERGDESLPDSDEVLADLILSYLRFYGPLKERELLWVFSAMKSARRVVDDLLEEGRLIGGSIREGTAIHPSEIEICDPESMEILLRLTRSHSRPDFEALPPFHLQLFLAQHQGLVQRGEDLEDLKLRMEQLIAYPLRTALWETEILPARLHPYFPAWLDRLVEDFGLFWLGCGKEIVTFLMERDRMLLKEGFPLTYNSSDSDILKKIFPHGQGRFPFFDLLDGSGMGAESLTENLWSLAWKGLVVNDSMGSLRTGSDHNFKGPSIARSSGGRRSGFSRWSGALSMGGNWRIVSWNGSDRKEQGEDGISDNGDATEVEEERSAIHILEDEERNRERVQILLGRYGILFRELLLRELPSFQWRSVVGTLRRMELSGEVLGGFFFHGIPSLQFMSPSAFRKLGHGLPVDQSYWINATDPASLCGIRLEGMPELPARLVGNHIFFVGVDPVIVSKRKGKEVDIRVAPDHKSLLSTLSFFREFLSRDRRPMARVEVEIINGVSATTSEYAEVFVEAGFYRSSSSLILRRQY